MVGVKLMEICMKRVLILLLFVLVVGCADRGPDSDWECPSCGWGVGEKALECPNCGDVYKWTYGSPPRFLSDDNPYRHIPVKREK